MGEYADMLLDGNQCYLCGEYIGKRAGARPLCSSCSEEELNKKYSVSHEEIDKAANEILKRLEPFHAMIKEIIIYEVLSKIVEKITGEKIEPTNLHIRINMLIGSLVRDHKNQS